MEMFVGDGVVGGVVGMEMFVEARAETLKRPSALAEVTAIRRIPVSFW
jgi:hypothetical protein